MYTISPEQQKEMQAFLDKMPDSIVKSQITNLFNEIFPTGRMTPEQLEKFMSFQNAIPKELETFPQTMAHWIKNDLKTTKDESKVDIAKGSEANLQGMAAEAHSVSVPKEEGDTGEQKQEILHTLNVEDKTLAGTKAEPRTTEDIPSYEEEIKAEATESAKSEGGKPEAQKKEEESIIARNRDVDTGARLNKKKDKVVVVNKKAVAKKAPAVKKSAPKKAAVKTSPKALKPRPAAKTSKPSKSKKSK